MTTELTTRQTIRSSRGSILLPEVIVSEGERAAERFMEFFAASIRNRNTRMAYARAVSDFFAWCQGHRLGLQAVRPLHVASYIEELTGKAAAPTVKQHLAAIRMLFDWMVTGQILPMNPASSVRGPKHVVKRGKTPVLDAGQARQLLDSIDVGTIAGLRDRALIAVMVYSFARVGAVVAMNGADYYRNGLRGWLRLHEKGGKQHEIPAHRTAEDYLHEYITAAGIADAKNAPLFRTLDRKRRITQTRMHRNDVLRMIKRRAVEAGIPVSTCCHTFRATGITVYLLNGGTLEKAQQIANHESPKTTKLYDRTSDAITLDEVDRIRI